MSLPLLITKNQRTNLTNKLIINQQQISHSKHLKQIYSKNCKKQCSPTSTTKITIGRSKTEKHQNEEHHRNVEHLWNFISRKKNVSDRLKDQHDFYAFPVYFFRKVQTENHKSDHKKKSKKINKIMSTNNLTVHSQSQQKCGINVQNIRKKLLNTHNISDQQLESYIQNIIKTIFDYNLNSKERIDFLENFVLETIKPYYPPEFYQTFQQIFEEIKKMLKFQQNCQN